MAEEDTVTSVSRAFRSAAGLPERTDGSVLSNGEAAELETVTEPEGGYGGEEPEGDEPEGTEPETEDEGDESETEAEDEEADQ